MTTYYAKDNVIFTLYKAALNGEITYGEFLKTKEIVKKSKEYQIEEITKLYNETK